MKSGRFAVVLSSLSLLAGCSTSVSAPLSLRAFVSEPLLEATVVNSASSSVCETLANRAGVDRPDTAWFPLLRRAGVDSVYVPPNQRFAFGGPWVDMNGQLLFQTADEILTGSPRSPFTMSEWGTPIPDKELVWTGMAPPTKDPDQGLIGLCLDRLSLQIWRSTSEEDTGFVGAVGATDFSWTAASELACNQRAHLYCFETERSRENGGR